MLHLLWYRPEPIDELGPERVDAALVLEFGQASVEGKPDAEIADVVLGNEHRGADRDLRRPLVRRRRSDPGLQTDHRLLEHLLIQLEADFLDVPRLFLAEQVAGAAD